MIRTMSNAAIHFGGGVAMGVLTVFAAVGMLGVMMARNSSLSGDKYRSPSTTTGSSATGRTPGSGL